MRILIGILWLSLIMACGTTAPSKPSPKHIRQSTRHLNLGSALYIKGCYVKALQHYQQAHERYTAADQIEGIAHSLNGIANVYYRLGEPPSAVAAYAEAFDSYGLIKDRSGMVQAMCNKAAALLSAGRLDEAKMSLDKADQLAGSDDIKPALRRKSKAILMIQRNALKPAGVLLQEAIQYANNGEPDQLSSTYYTLGRLRMAQNRPSQAIPYLNNSLSLDRATGAYDDIANDLNALGECHAQLNQMPQAVAYFKRSIKIYALLGNATKVQALIKQLKMYALSHDKETQSTLHWVAQWLAGNKEANLCR